MKTIITSLAIFMTAFTFGQTLTGNAKKTTLKDAKVTDFKIEVTVDDAQELESTFKVEDFREILNESEPGEAVTFKLTCNGRVLDNGVKSHVSYKIEGNTNNIDDFLEGVKKVREAGIKYYNKK
ncbi:hypothetical protein Q2T40_20555 [Winogradskyella maritima]|uniref:Uncharacterized protein n=1 Tax=Winogradskyella maritima TaxID=1517766 RepID=A0ABV8ADP4_9FLAO|nr:hypothetical protein [Winogradskyella maritima]